MECPDCSSTYVVKRGRREVRHGSRQLYHCNNCGRDFVDAGFRNKSYPAKVVIAALKEYLSGSTLTEASNRVNQRFKVNTSKSTVHGWVKEFSDVCGYTDLKQEYGRKYGTDLVEEHVFEHSGVEYDFKYHRAKLGEAGSRFPELVDFVENVVEECPDDLFGEEAERSSQLGFDIDAQVSTSRNNACELAELALKAVDDRNQRHEQVQDFMLKTDSATLAVELPVWWYHKPSETTVTGHIDVVQQRAGKVFILDYKPKAEEVRPLGQLWSYARGLSYRTETPLSRFRAAWFNEDVYHEFVPAAVGVSG